MLPPHELKNKTFSKVVRGYNPVEVDEQIEFIVEKYTELYRYNDELERKLRTAMSKIDAYKNEEESIRNALINAQKAGAGIINEATARADTITQSAKSNCEKVLAEFDRKVEEKRETISELTKRAENFRAHLFEEYTRHIELIERMVPDDAEDELPTVKECREAVTSEVKKDAEAFDDGHTVKDEIPAAPRIDEGKAVKPDDDDVPELENTSRSPAVNGNDLENIPDDDIEFMKMIKEVTAKAEKQNNEIKKRSVGTDFEVIYDRKK